MFSQPRNSEIDHRTGKLIVGAIAISLATLTEYFSGAELASISASYHVGGWARDIFVGFLFAIAAFLLAYNGQTTPEMLLSKVAAFAAMGVAMFPCRCEVHPEIVKNVHAVSAVVMFIILALFCYMFFLRAKAKNNKPANFRALIYAICGATIVLAIGILAFDYASAGKISAHIHRLTFYGERAGLIAFGVSWLIASRVIPIISGDERFSPFK